jgi:hypothetical protein
MVNILNRRKRVSNWGCQLDALDWERWDPTRENGDLGIQLTAPEPHENGEGICSADKGSNRRIQTNDSFRIRKGGVKTRSRIRGAEVGWMGKGGSSEQRRRLFRWVLGAGCWLGAGLCSTNHAIDYR